MPCQFPRIKSWKRKAFTVLKVCILYLVPRVSHLPTPWGGETKDLGNEVVDYALDSAEDTSSWNPLSYHTMFRPLFLWEKGQHSHK